MDKLKFDVEVIDENDVIKFQGKLEDFLNNGYELKACSIGFANSEQYDFCSVCKAILVRENTDG